VEIVVLGEGSGDDEMRRRRIKKQALDDTNLRGLLRQIDILERVSKRPELL
jgi:hypothetical protein